MQKHNRESEDLSTEVLAFINNQRELIAETALELGNVFAPIGREQLAADAVSAWYQKHGIESFQQQVAPERSNVIATLPGSGGGKSLLFNAHLDTELANADYDRLMGWLNPNDQGGWREGDRLFGHTILNDRGLMAAFMVVAKALSDFKVPLKGDVLFTSVVGEAGIAPVDEYQGTAYIGEGYGTRFLVDHGVRADYVLVAEATAFGLSWVNCGACYIKITLRGQNMYTPRMTRPEAGDISQHPNAIVKAAAVIDALESWAIQYERNNVYQSACGEVHPKAQVGAVRGGLPYRPNRSAPVCMLYMDIRTAPGANMTALVGEIRELVHRIIPDAEVEAFVTKDGVEGQNVESLAGVIARAHEAVRGTEPPPARVFDTSMFSDINIFNSVGIPALVFGAGRKDAAYQGMGYFELDDMVAAAKIYALVAMDVCG